MNKMNPQDLVYEINHFCDTMDSQDDLNLLHMMFHYRDMFEKHCGVVPEFEITDDKGHVKLTKVKLG